MINIKKFIYDELNSLENLKKKVSEKIFNAKAPVKTTLPFVSINNISDAKINHFWKRVELHQISVWSKDPDELEELKNIIVNKFFKLKKSPIEICNIDSINETENKESEIFGIHIRIKIVALETEI